MVNSVTLVGFVGSDPEQRQAKGNRSKFIVLSVATQRSWKNAEDEWVSKVEWHRIAIFRPRLAESVLNGIRKGAHVLVEGSLFSTTYERVNAEDLLNSARERRVSLRQADAAKQSLEPRVRAQESEFGSGFCLKGEVVFLGAQRFV